MGKDDVNEEDRRGRMAPLTREDVERHMEEAKAEMMRASIQVLRDRDRLKLHIQDAGGMPR